MRSSCACWPGFGVRERVGARHRDAGVLSVATPLRVGAPEERERWERGALQSAAAVAGWLAAARLPALASRDPINA